MDSLKASDAEAGRHAVAPRVTLADIEGAIAERIDLNAADAVVEGANGVTRQSIEQLMLIRSPHTNAETHYI